MAFELRPRRMPCLGARRSLPISSREMERARESIAMSVVLRPPLHRALIGIVIAVALVAGRTGAWPPSPRSSRATSPSRWTGSTKTLNARRRDGGAQNSLGQPRADRSATASHSPAPTAQAPRPRHSIRRHRCRNSWRLSAPCGSSKQKRLDLDERRQRQAHLMESADQRVRPGPPGHLARAAQHDGGDRRARISRLRDRRAGAELDADPLWRAARQLAAGHGDRRARQRLSPIPAEATRSPRR